MLSSHIALLALRCPNLDQSWIENFNMLYMALPSEASADPKYSSSSPNWRYQIWQHYLYAASLCYTFDLASVHFKVLCVTFKALHDLTPNTYRTFSPTETCPILCNLQKKEEDEGTSSLAAPVL